MPQTKSAKKELRKTKIRTARNLRKKRYLRQLTKKILALVQDDKQDEAKKLFSSFQKVIDKAAKTQVIKKNTAARKKSRLSKKLRTAKEKK